MLRVAPLAFASFLALCLPLTGCGDDHRPSGGNAGTGTMSSTGGNAGGGTGGSGSVIGGRSGLGGHGGLAGRAAGGGSDTSGDAGASETAGTAGATVDTGNPAAALYAAICDLHRACCETAGFAQNKFTSCDVSAGSDVYRASIAAGRLSIDDAALASCAEHLRTTYVGCDSVLGFDDTFGSFPDCIGGLAGAVPLGEACGFDEECVGAGDGRVVCVNDLCVAVPIGQAGDPCIQTKGPRSTRPIPGDVAAAGGAECRRQDGLYCHADSDTSYTCAPVLADGEPCDAEDQCGASSYCTGTCDPVKAADTSCTSNSECGVLYCNHDSLTCTNLPDRASCEG